MVLKIIVALVAFIVIVRMGLFVLRALATPAPSPEEGELRRVNLKYQCTVCGAQVRMTKAGEDLPAPPRHCLEDMELVAPIE
ncbi:MAG: hypothetical protein M3083_06070 [Actinomycetota bacterium]|nr:hypothetical protein [Actinomycetota bacterium]